MSRPRQHHKTQFEILEDEIQERHESNEERFDTIEKKVVELNTTVKLILALLLANGALNVAHFFVK